jgi:hypothetical protein
MSTTPAPAIRRHAPTRLRACAAAACLSLAGCTAEGGPQCTLVARERTPLAEALRRTEFLGIGGFVPGADGGLVVLDSREDRIVAFDSSGRVRWSRGRSGSGPMEFGHGTGLSWAGDLLAFRDLDNHRLLFWTRDGDLAATVSLSAFPTPGYPGWVGVLDSTRIVIAVPPTGQGTHGTGVLVLSTRGAPRADTIARFGFPLPVPVRVQGGTLPVLPPLAGFPGMGMGRDGSIALSHADAYRLEVFDSAGRRSGTVQGPADRPPVDRADRREYLARFARGASTPPLPFPSHHPAILGLTGSPDGTLLVATAWKRGRAVRWDEWRQDGTYVRSLLLPQEVTEAVGFRGRVFASFRDQDDVLWVTSYAAARQAPCPGPVPSPRT